MAHPLPSSTAPLSAASVLGSAPSRPLTDAATVSQLARGRRLRYLATLCECGIDRLMCERESVSDGDDQRHTERVEAKS